MLFDDVQSYTAFKSSCRLSSAKLTSLDADTSVKNNDLLMPVLG